MNRIDLPEDPTNIPTLQYQYTYADIVKAVEASIAEMRTLVAQISDAYIVFEPDDPDAHDKDAENPDDVHLAWNIGHNVVHYNASGEEVASITSILARGIEVHQRVRWEFPWQTVTTQQQTLDLLDDSKRIRLAYFDAWPTEPHLDVQFYKYNDWIGPMNAIGYGLFGLRHDYAHIDQVAKIIKQAQEKGI